MSSPLPPRRRSYLQAKLLECTSKVYVKYSSSQNYYYTREVNEIIFKQEGTRSIILFRDFQHFDNPDGEEYFQKTYPRLACEKKMVYLSEYYKFHNDIPRLFMEPQNHALNYFHDKHRKIKYLRITKMLQQLQLQDQQPAEEEQDSNMQQTRDPAEDDDDDVHHQPMERLLAPLDEDSLNEQSNHNTQSHITLRRNNNNNIFFIAEQHQQQQQHHHHQQQQFQHNHHQQQPLRRPMHEDTLNDKSCSNTINLLHQRLKDFAQSRRDNSMSGSNNSSSFTSCKTAVGGGMQGDFGNLDRFLQFCEQNDQPTATPPPLNLNSLFLKKKQSKPTIEIPTASTYLAPPTVKPIPHLTTTISIASSGLYQQPTCSSSSHSNSQIRTQPSLVKQPQALPPQPRDCTSQSSTPTPALLSKSSLPRPQQQPPQVSILQQKQLQQHQQFLSAHPPQHPPLRKVPLLDLQQQIASTRENQQPQQIQSSSQTSRERESLSSARTVQTSHLRTNNPLSSRRGSVTKPNEADVITKMFAEKQANREVTTSNSHTQQTVRGSLTERTGNEGRLRVFPSAQAALSSSSVAAAHQATTVGGSSYNSISFAMNQQAPPPSMFSQKTSPLISPHVQFKIHSPPPQKAIFAPFDSLAARLQTSPLRVTERKHMPTLMTASNIIEASNNSLAKKIVAQQQSKSRSSSTLRGGSSPAVQSSDTQQVLVTQYSTKAGNTNEQPTQNVKAKTSTVGLNKPRGKSVHFLQPEPRYLDSLNNKTTLSGSNNPPASPSAVSKSKSTHGPSGYLRIPSTAATSGVVVHSSSSGIVVHSSLSSFSHTTAESSSQGTAQLRRSHCQDTSPNNLRNSQELPPNSSKTPKRQVPVGAADQTRKSQQHQLQVKPQTQYNQSQQRDEEQLQQPVPNYLPKKQQPQQLFPPPQLFPAPENQRKSQEIHQQITPLLFIKNKQLLPQPQLQPPPQPPLTLLVPSRKASLNDAGYSAAIPSSKSVHMSTAASQKKTPLTNSQHQTAISRDKSQGYNLRNHFATTASLCTVQTTTGCLDNSNNYDRGASIQISKESVHPPPPPQHLLDGNPSKILNRNAYSASTHVLLQNQRQASQANAVGSCYPFSQSEEVGGYASERYTPNAEGRRTAVEYATTPTQQQKKTGGKHLKARSEIPKQYQKQQDQQQPLMLATADLTASLLQQGKVATKITQQFAVKQKQKKDSNHQQASLLDVLREQPYQNDYQGVVINQRDSKTTSLRSTSHSSTVPPTLQSPSFLQYPPSYPQYNVEFTQQQQFINNYLNQNFTNQLNNGAQQMKRSGVSLNQEAHTSPREALLLPLSFRQKLTETPSQFVTHRQTESQHPQQLILSANRLHPPNEYMQSKQHPINVKNLYSQIMHNNNLLIASQHSN